MIKKQKIQGCWNKCKPVMCGVGIATFFIGGCIFIVYEFNSFVESEHQRIRKEMRQEIESALAEKQNVIDAITYDSIQKTK